LLTDEGERIALVIRQHEARLGSFNLQSPSPVHRIHRVHPLEAEADSPLAFQVAVDVALLQPGVIGGADAAAILRHYATLSAVGSLSSVS